MALLRAACCLAFAAAASPSNETCGMANYDPQYGDFMANVSKQVPGWAVVDLDLPPRQRWQALVAPKTAEIQAMIDAFKGSMGRLFHLLLNVVEDIIGPLANLEMNGFPEDYAEEIRGIHDATGIRIPELFVFNIMYEFSGALPECTSIVAQNSAGHIMHGRNLDFGPPVLSEAMRQILQNVRYVKDGQTLFNSTTYLGYVGCTTCLKHGVASLTVNTRLWTKLPMSVAAWLLHLRRKGNWLAFETRRAMETADSYAEAVELLNTTRLLGPAYVILAGVAAGEGAVITRDEKHSLAFWSLEDEPRPYLVETNYDHWKRDLDNWVGPPYARRDNGNACMERIVNESRVTSEGMFQVLSSRPSLNRDTTFTALMSARDGTFEAYFQNCPDCGADELTLV